MPIRTLSRQEMKIDTEDDVVLVRRRARELAQKRGFDPFATAAITTATSELTRNVIMHAGRGTALIEEVDDGQRGGLRLTFRDDGPGIADIDRVMVGGYSTSRSLGLGLSGSKRLVDEFKIESRPGAGTCICITKWTRF